MKAERLKELRDANEAIDPRDHDSHDAAITELIDHIDELTIALSDVRNNVQLMGKRVRDLEALEKKQHYEEESMIKKMPGPTRPVNTDTPTSLWADVVALNGRRYLGFGGRPITGACTTCGAPTCESMGMNLCAMEGCNGGCPREQDKTDSEFEKCEFCGSEWRRGAEHPPGLRGLTVPCPRAENTRPRTEAELKIEKYRFARAACEFARVVLKEHDIEQILKDINRADAVGMFVDPTLWRDKHQAMDEDKMVFAAALKFLRTWPKKEDTEP